MLTIKHILHIIVLVFFTLLLIYSFFYNNDDIIEGLDNDVMANAKSNASDIITLKKQVEEIEGVDKDVTRIDKQSKKDAQDIGALSIKLSQMKIQAQEKMSEVSKPKK
jgi:hypothetical protein